MNVQTKYVKANFVPSGSLSYNQQIAKRFFKNQNTKKDPKINISKTYLNPRSLENEVASTSLDKTGKRVDIEKWLKSLDLESRVRIFTIQNKWLTQMIQQMFFYYRMNPNNKFLLKPDDISNEEYHLQYYYNENHQHYFNLVNENNYPIDIFFKYLAFNENSTVNEEKLFLEKLRFIDLKESNDTFSFSVSLLNNLEEIFYFFDFFSRKKAFVNPCTYSLSLHRVNYDNIMKLYHFNFPSWFNIKSYNTIPEIIIAHFEQIVYIKFWVHETQLKQLCPERILSSNFSVQDEYKLNEIINSRRTIINFLKKEFSHKKDKLFDKIDIISIINEIKNDQNLSMRIKFKKQEFSKNLCYRINTLRYDYLDHFLYNTDLDCYKLHDEIKKSINYLTEETFVDELLFSNLERTQTYEDYLYKKVFEKLYNLNSDKNAKDLLSGETEKTKNTKKKGKKKISTLKENSKENETKNDAIDCKYRNFLKSVYMNSVNNSKLLIKGMCKSIIESLIANILNNENFVSNYSKTKKKTDELLNEIIRKESLINSLNNNPLDNNENFSVNDETTVSSANISDNKSTQNIFKYISPTSDKFRRTTSKDKIIVDHKRKNSIKIPMIDTTNTLDRKVNTDDITLKEESEENHEVDLNSEEKENFEHNLNDILDINTLHKKKKNKHKKYKNRKGSTNSQSFNQNNLKLVKKTIVESLKVNTNQAQNLDIKSDSSEITLKQSSPRINNVKTTEKMDITNCEELISSSNISNSTKETNVKTIQSVNNNISNNNVYGNYDNQFNTLKPKFNKYNNLNSSYNMTRSFTKKNMVLHEDLSFSHNTNNPININPDPIISHFNYLPYIPTNIFPTNLDFDKNYLMTMMNPFINNPIENINILRKFEESLFPKNFEIRLHNDILDYSNNIIKVNNLMREIKLEIISILEKYIKLGLDNNNLFIDIHGSFATDLSIECSDIDLTVRLVESLINTESLINSLYTYFSKLHIFDSLNPIYTATVPILKIQVNPLNVLNGPLKQQFLDFINSDLYNKYNFDKEELNKMKIDITFTDKLSKTHCTYSAVEWVKKQLILYPEIKPLVHVIKRHLQINKLNSSFNGGLSSHSLLLMIVAFIKYSKTIKMRTIMDIGSTLIEFYNFFGNFFDFASGIIDINQINPILMIKERFESFPIIHDPLNYSNVAKNSYRIKEIKQIFSNAFDILQNKKQELIGNHNCMCENENMINEVFFFYKKSIILSSN